MADPYGAQVIPPNFPQGASVPIGVQAGVSGGLVQAQVVIVSGSRAGIFVYSGTPAFGNLIGSWASTAGTDQFGNGYPAGFTTYSGNSTIEGNNFILNSNGLFIYNQASSGPTVVTFTSGSAKWTAPSGVTTVLAECWGGGGGGCNGNGTAVMGGPAGGGGEYAADPAVAVTPGSQYTYAVGAGGAGGAQGSGNNAGSNGVNSTFAGNSVTVTGHNGGGGGAVNIVIGGTAGTGSANATHFNGGAGGGDGFQARGGCGGGGSGGTASAGNSGADSISNLGAAGASAVTGGGTGGMGGRGGTSNPSAGSVGGSPGAGGGGGGVNQNTGIGFAGGTGSAGQVRLTYTPTASLALITSICGIATTDPLLGVSCPVGFTAYAATSTTQANMNAGIQKFIDSVNDAQAAGSIGLATVSATNDSLQLISPANLATDQQSILSLVKVATGSVAYVQVANAALNLKTSVTPAAPTNGTDLYVDAAGKLAMIPLTGTAMQMPACALATFPGTTVTQAALTTIASATYPANDAEVGSVYELEVWGNGVQGSTLETLEFACVFAGNTMAGNFTIGTTSWATTSIAFRWRMIARVICHTTGSGGTWSSLIHGEVSQSGTNLIPSNSSNETGAFIECESSATTAVSTLSNQTLALQCAWGATTGAPTLTSRVALFKRIA